MLTLELWKWFRHRDFQFHSCECTFICHPNGSIITVTQGIQWLYESLEISKSYHQVGLESGLSGPIFRFHAGIFSLKGQLCARCPEGVLLVLLCSLVYITV